MLLGLISAEEKRVRIYFKLIKQSQVVAAGALLAGCWHLLEFWQRGRGQVPRGHCHHHWHPPSQNQEGLGSDSGFWGHICLSVLGEVTGTPHQWGWLIGASRNPLATPMATGALYCVPSPKTHHLATSPLRPLFLRIPSLYKVDFRVSSRTITNS